MQLAPQLPWNLWAAFVIVLPFCLGMAGTLRSGTPLYARNPVRNLIGQGLTLATLTIYVGILFSSGMAPAFLALFATVTAFYFLGVLFGMTLRGLLLIGAGLFAVLVLSRLALS